VTGPLAAPPLSRADPASSPSRGRLLLIAFVAIAWGAILIVMACLTANPVTLNRDQILRADLIITGKVESETASGEVSVSREWTRNGLTGTIHVENLDDAHVRRGETYLLPLSPASTGYRVTDARLTNAAALAYPATPTAIEQLEQILADRPGKHDAGKNDTRKDDSEKTDTGKNIPAKK
jgi:hypothetical protein